MNTGSCARSVSAAILVALVCAGAPAVAQVVIETVTDVDQREEGIRLDGFMLEGGIAAPTHGDQSFLFGARVGLGTLVSRHLDFSVGLRHWSSDIDRSEFGVTTPGTFSDTALDMVLAYPLMRVAGMRPYLGAGLAGHVVGADVPGDRSLEDALSGFNIGALAVIGVGTTRPGIGLRLQARRDFVEDVGAWSYTLGVGWWPKERAQKSLQPLQLDTNNPSGLTISPAAAPVQNVAPATTPVQPVAVAPAPATPSPADQELISALNHLKTQNDELAANVTQLQQQMKEEATKVVPVEPVPAPAPAPAPVVAPEPDRSTQLFDALQRVTAMAGYPQSLNRTGDTGLLTLDQSLLFASGASRLTTGAREELRRLGVVFLRFPEVQIVVQGHSDSVGRPEANEVLSERRAQAVRNELLSIGLRFDTIEAVGYGDTRPVANNETADGRARNRRVDLLITMPATKSN